MCLYCEGKVWNCSINSCGRSWSAHEGTTLAYTKAKLGKNCLSSHSCHFFKTKSFMHMFNVCLHCEEKVSICSVILSKKKFLYQTPSCICSMCLHCIGKVSNCSIKTCGRSWSAHEGTIYEYTKAILGENCLSSYSCHFVKNCFFEPNSFMHMFNVSKLYGQNIKLLHQKLW